MSSDNLSPRAASLLRTLVDIHIREGQPVGSKALHVESGMAVSPATIRNVMSDLEDRGYLSSPHTSAGRIPTSAGYRLFVDTLVRYRQPKEGDIDALRTKIQRRTDDAGSTDGAEGPFGRAERAGTAMSAATSQSRPFSSAPVNVCALLA